MTTIQNMLADMRRELMSANPPLGVSGGGIHTFLLQRQIKRPYQIMGASMGASAKCLLDISGH